jgi:integrase
LNSLLATDVGCRYSARQPATIERKMPALNFDLFDETAMPGPQNYLDAFESWLSARAQFGVIRERSSVAVYRSMWSALTAWCVSRGLYLDDLQPGHFEAYLHSRGGVDELTARHAWRLLMLADAVQTHRASAAGVPRNASAHELLMATPEWRYANATDKTPLPGHLDAAEARHLVQWLLDPASGSGAAGAPAHTWQALRNRAAAALQLGAGLTPGDIRAAAVDGVVSEGGRTPGLPWKIRLPRHGAIPTREAPVAPWAGRLLRTWLDTRCALRICGDALFPAARDGRPWGKVAQYAAAKAVLEAAGVPDTEGGSFKLRHTFAMRQLRRGTAPETVAQWLGLSDVAALARYRRVLMAQVQVI